MPNYSFYCQDCSRDLEIYLTYQEYDQRHVACPACGSHNIIRKIEKIRLAKSDDSRLNDLTDPSQLEGIEDDPAALGHLMRKMGDELGEDIRPEFDEVVSRLEKGDDIEKIAQDMPDLGDETIPFDDNEI